MFNQNRAPDDLLTEIVIPKPPPKTVMAYTKLRTRAAIDYPELGVAVLAERNDQDLVTRAEVCVTALAAQPIRIKNLKAAYAGKALNEDTINAIAAIAFKRCKPLTNIASDPSYRREMVPVFVRRAFQKALVRTESKQP